MAKPFTHLEPVLHCQDPSPRTRSKGEVLLLHDARKGPDCWNPLLEFILEAGFKTNCLELPGHGHKSWSLPASTSREDYFDLSWRAAQGLKNPVLVGHGLGGWLAQKILEKSDLPALLLAPYPGRRLALPSLAPCWKALRGKHVRGRPKEPVRVVLEFEFGLLQARARPGKARRLVVAAGEDHILPVQTMHRLARSLGADLEVLTGATHDLWTRESSGELANLIKAFLNSLPQLA